MTKQEIIKDWLDYLENKGCLVIEVTDDSIRYYDRNMNKSLIPILGEEDELGENRD